MWFLKLLQDFGAWIDKYLANFEYDPEVDPRTLPMNLELPPTQPIQPAVTHKPVTPPESMLEKFCHAIKEFEGWGPPGATVNGIYYQHGTASYRRNNPGNCRFSSVGYAKIYGEVLKSENNFAIFKDYATGWLYLKNLILSKVAKAPNQTIQEFFRVYAPANDGNDPDRYAMYVAKRCGVKSDYPMNMIV